MAAVFRAFFNDGFFGEEVNVGEASTIEEILENIENYGVAPDVNGYKLRQNGSLVYVYKSSYFYAPANIYARLRLAV